jgi:hypothetical protein
VPLLSRRKFAEKIRIGQKLKRVDGGLHVAEVYQVWRKTEQAQIKFPNGGKAIYGFKDLQRTWYCDDWHAFDPTRD